VRLTKLLNDVDHTVGEASRAALSPGVIFINRLCFVGHSGEAFAGLLWLKACGGLSAP
jgi:hypothetical protein